MVSFMIPSGLQMRVPSLSVRQVRVILLTSGVLFIIILGLAANSRTPRISVSSFVPTTLYTTTTTTCPKTEDGTVDWGKYAYVQYVTQPDYLCNSLMLFERLHTFNSKADRLMLYPREWKIAESPEENESVQSRLLRKARDEYNTKLEPIQVQKFPVQDSTWAESFTKLLSFNQTAYQRVLLLDSDSTVLKPMDELFLLPSTPLAMPRAYWLDPKPGDRILMSAQLLLIEPSEFEFHRIQEAFKTKGKNDYDMEIVNDLFKDNCMVIPHRRYNLLSGEFKGNDHARYLGSAEEVWNATAALEEAKYLHFSDWPFPKPWIRGSDRQRKEVQPKCHPIENSDKEDCTDQEIWNALYTDFTKRRKEVCDLGQSGRRRKVKRDPLETGVWS